uniref:Uncharacterized protein n=1 Tax=Picea sitchensis TaxID=3332 RepID=D5AC70_PICSI|nr:unknown [Picea sitchensis]
MFRDLFMREGFKSDYVFDWTILKYQQTQISASPRSTPILGAGKSGIATGLTERFSAGQEGHAGTSRATEGFNRRASGVNGIALNRSGSQSKYKSSGQDGPSTSKRVGAENERGNSSMRTGSTSRRAVLSSRPTVSTETGEQSRSLSNFLPSSLRSSGSAVEPKRTSISRNPSMRSQQENCLRNFQLLSIDSQHRR